MKKFIFLLFTLTTSLLSFAQGSITYELNGGITNDFGWQNKQDMYETLNADWNAYSGTSTTWKTLVELNGDVAAGIPNQAGAMNLTFLENEGFKLHFSWLITYLDATCTTQGVTLCSSNASYLRYNLAAFFLNTQRTSWPKTADYTLAGDVKYFQPTWKGGFCGPTEYAKDEVVTLPIPYKEGKTFAGWYKKADFSGDKITVISGSGDITLYAKWVEYIPNITEVIAMVDGTTTTVQGIVTYVEGDNFWIQDDTGGLFCYGKENNVKEGELVTISGNKATYYGSAKLENAIVIEQTTTNILEPQTLLLSTINTNKTDYLNELIYLEGVTISRFESENKTLYLTDGLNEIALYNWDGITEDKFPVGSKVSVKAVLSIHDTTLQLRGKEAWLVTATAVGKDNYEYPEVETDGYKFNLTNNWLYSVNLNNWSENRPNPLAEGSRSVVEKDGILYFSYRDNNNPIEQPRLVRIDAQTGKMLNPIFFADYIFKDVNGNWLFGPYTDLKLDNEGNAITSNLPISGGAFQIWNVDLETGEGRLIVDLATDSTKWLSAQFPENTTIRLDRIGVYGDINGDATIMSVVSSGADVYYWTIEDGKWDGETNWIKLGLGEGVNVGGAPVICPIEGDYFYVDGFTTYPLLFDPDGNLVDAFDEAHEANHLMLGTKGVQRGKSHNGVTEFEVNGEYYLLCAGDNTNGNATAPSTFVLYKFADEYRAFKDITPLYEFPMAGMGGATNPQRVATSFARPNKEGTSIDIFVFTAENGYGKYTLSLEKINDIIASGTCGDNLTWKLTKDGVLTISGAGKMYDYTSTTQPWNSYKQQIKTININDGVTSIGVSAFYYCDALTSITIPNSVTSIGEFAFSSCSSLTSITIPNSVTSIGYGAFSGCSSLTSITIGNSVTSIGNSAFSSCLSLTSITIPNSVTSIGERAFYECSSLTSITIPNSVTSIGEATFYNCSSLTSITIPNSVTSIGDYAFSSCSSLTSITIPNSVTSIGDYAFQGCSSLTSITIPNSVTSIGDYAFQGCSGLTSINIEATIPPTIETNTFNIAYIAYKNIPITIPCGSLSAYQSANYWSEFTNYVAEFPYTFSATTADATMGSVTIETAPACGVDAVIKATPNAGYRFVKWSDGNTENPRTITVTEDITLTAEFANDIIASGTCGDNLTWQLTKDGVLTISGTGKMYDYTSTTQPWNSYKQQIKTININDGVTSIGNFAFLSCSSLTSITIPNSVTSIGNYAFRYCSSLTSITIPNSVTSIGNYAFYYCSSLTSIEVDANNQNYASIDGALYDKDVTILICCPGGKTSITIPNSVTSIGNSAFEYCSSLTSITIPNSVTSIGNSAFEYCSSLTSITIPNSVTSIGNYAFSYCSHLTSITIGNSVTSIGNNAFYYCSSLTSITIGNSVTSIGDGAFSGCSGLTSVTIPNSVTSIGSSAFSGCSGLTSVTIPNSVTSIHYSAFQGCSNITEVHIYDIAKWCDIEFSSTTSNPLYSKIAHLYINNSKITDLVIPEGVDSIKNNAFADYALLNSVTIPNSVTSIGERAFLGCSSLTSITIPNSVTSIGSSAFYGCSSLTSITIPNSVTSIGNYAFYNCSSLTSINIEATIPPTIGGANTFNYVSKNIPVTVPCGSLSAYQSANYWSEFTNFRESFPYTFSATTADATMGSVTIETAPACGVDAVIKATPNDDYRFVKWSDGNTENPRTITVTEDITLTAEFANDIIASGTCGDNLTWKLTFDSVLTISGTGKMYDYNSSDQPWNSYKQQIKTININDGVTSIGNYAFYECSSLTSITIPNSVTSIGEWAFRYCSSLTSITIPNSVTSIGQYAFAGCSSLASITIPNSVTSIGRYAFSFCRALTFITIPNSVTSIGEYAFYSCSSLTSIEVNADNPNYTSIGGVLYNKDVTTLICCPGGKTSITIPNSVTSIGDAAFSFCSSLTSITIPNSVTSIGNYAFSYCSSLISITIPNSVTSIGYYAFYYCYNLTSITIPNSVTSIGEQAFWNCSSLTSINIEATTPPTLEKANTFYNVSKNIPVTVPCGSLSAYQSANYWSEFTNYVAEFPYTFSATTADATMGSVTIETAPACGVDAVIKATPNAGCRFVKWSDGNTENPRTITVTEDITLTAEFVNDIIASGTCGDNLTWELSQDYTLTISGTGAMYNYNSDSQQPWYSYLSSIKSVVINKGVTRIGKSAFDGCSGLTSITIPNNVTFIGAGAFRGCSSLTSITIPNTVTSISDYAFYVCSGLTSITIPNTVTSIGKSAFSGCSSLTSITIPNSVTSIGNSAFSACSGLTSITIPNTVTSIGRSAFYNCSNLTSITIPNTVTSISDYAFYGCSGLTSITIPNSITSIGNDAFRGCSSLTSITIPNTVTSIGRSAFSGCSGLTTIIIPNGVTSIGWGAFSDCFGLTSITIPNSVTSIGYSAFSDCFGLTSITIPNSVTSIGNSAFSGCSGLTSITIPNSITSIGNYVFDGCSGLTSITIPNTVTSIGNSAFRNCSRLTSITIPNSVTSIGDYAFDGCSGLTSISIEATTPPTITSSTFTDVSIPVTIPCGSLSAYQSANYWSEFTNYVEEFPYTFSATTADATMGSVTIETAPACGVDAVIKATPNDGYHFVKWSDGNTNATRTIVVTSDLTLTAEFAINSYIVTLTTENGKVTGAGKYTHGSQITITATPNDGYRFVKWSDGITTNPRTITVTQNISLEAIFEALYVNWYPDNNDEHSFLGKHYYDTVTITAGKTLIIEDNATIACNDIVIKADKNGNVPDIKVVGDIIANNGVTYEWQIDDTRWYFFSLPFNCKIQDITLSTIANGPKDGVWNYYNPNDGSGDFIIRKYNQKNASNGQGKKTGWEDCKGNEMLHKGRGYIIGLFPSGSKAKAMFKSEKQELLSKLIEQELDFGDDHSWFDYQAGDNALYNGWNLVGIPYFEAFSQGELDAAYVSIPNSDGVTYKQYTLNEALNKGLLRPFMSFFIQLGENRAPIFSPNDRSNAPMLRERENSVNNKIIIDIRHAENEELSDKTTIINNVALTAEYEIGHDLQKMIGYAEQPQIYTIEECGILAFNAQDVSSRMSIRLGVYAPVDGEYVIGGEAWGDMADVMLYDNETYRSTSLIIPQTIYLEKGVHDERFEIRVQSSSIPTGVDNEMSDLEVMIEEGRLYVENVPANSVLYIYDMNGKLVHQQRTDTAIDYEFYAQGIYNITICTDNNKVFNTKIAY